MAIALLGVGAGAAPAQAAGNNLTIAQNSAGQIAIQQGQVLQAGPVVKVNVSSSYSAADPEIFQLRNGATLAQMDTKIAEAGQGGQVAENAMWWFLQNTTFYGGLSAQGSVAFDLIMPKGTYYVAQLRPVGNVKPSTTAKQFQVVGKSNAIQPYADQKLTITDTNGVDRFSAYSVSGSALHNGPITVANKTGGIGNPGGELHFAQFTQVQPGTTDADVQAWLAGGTSPVLAGGAVLNFGTLSPQRPAHLYLNLPPGKYVVLSWIPDKDTGIPHALEGMFKLVDVV